MAHGLKRLCAAAASIFAIAAHATTLAPFTYYYLDGVLKAAQSGGAVVTTPSAYPAMFGPNIETQFTAIPPEGHGVEKWLLFSAREMIYAANLETFSPSCTYYGTTITARGIDVAGVETTTGAFYLAPSFKWYSWTLAYNANDPRYSGNFGAVALSYTNSVTLASPDSLWSETPAGCEFKGWATSSAGAAAYAAGATVENAGAAFGAAENAQVVLYAVWEKRPMAIALDARGGVAPQSAVTVYIGDKYALGTPVREGCDFLGWFTAPDGGEKIADGSEVVRDDITTLYAHWKEFSYTLGYDWNYSGAPVAPPGATLSYSSAAALASAPAAWKRTGCEFAGWALSSAAARADFAPGQMLSPSGRALGVAADGASIRLYGVWEKRPMTIALDAATPEDAQYQPVFDPPDAAGSIVAYIGEKYSLPEPARRDAWFRGWWTDAAETGTSIQIKSGDEVSRDDITVLRARWEPKAIYTVALDWRRGAEGEAVSASQQVFERDAAVPPSAAELDSWTGHTFLGWSRDIECITENFAASALYKTNEYRVVFYPGPAQGRMDAQPFIYDVPQALAPNAFKRGKTDAWIFAGWATNDVSDVAAYADCEEVAKLSAIDGGVVELDALWERSTDDFGYAIGSDVALKLRAGDSGCLATNDVAEADGAAMIAFPRGRRTALQANIYGSGTLNFRAFSDLPFVQAGATPGIGMPSSNEYGLFFKTNAVAVEAVSPQCPTNLAAYSVRIEPADGGATLLEFEVNSQWQAVFIGGVEWIPDGRINVSFDANGGVGEMPDAEFYVGDYGTLPRNRFARAGYTFSHWLDASTAACYDDRECTDAIAADTVLSAQWKANTCTICYTGGEGATGEMSDQTLSYGKEETLAKNAFAKTGCKFAGWRSGEIVYADGATVSNLSEEDGATFEFVAIWQPVAYTVAFAANGGEGAMPPLSLEYYESVALPRNAFSRTGYSFAGWAKTPDGEAVFADGGEIANLATDDGAQVTLCAVWKPISYTIRFAPGEGAGAMDDLTLEFDASAALPANAFAREGHVFAGWSAQDGAVFADGAQVANLAAEDGALVVLTALWKAAEDDESGGASRSLLPSGIQAAGEFTGAAAATYNGWLRDKQSGEIRALLKVATKASKGAATVKSTITATWLGGGKSVYRTVVATGGNNADEFGIIYGELALGGSFQGMAVEAARDFSKSKAGTAGHALAAEMPQGVWTLVFDAGGDYALFTLTVSKKGKAKLAGTLPGRKRVSISSQGVLAEDKAFAIPVVNAKNGIGFVVWIEKDATASVDANGNGAWKLASAAPLANLADGVYSLAFEAVDGQYWLERTELDQVAATPALAPAFTVSGGKWKAVKTAGKIALDKNFSPPLSYVKIASGRTPANLARFRVSYAAKKGTASGSFKLWRVENGRLVGETVKFAGMLSGGRFYATAEGLAGLEIVPAQ